MRTGQHLYSVNFSLRLVLVPFVLSSFLGCQELFGPFSEVTPPPLGPRICGSREYRCSGAALERCSDDRTRWEVVEQCESIDHCNVNSESCRACSAGEYACFNQGELWQCGANASWTLVQNCASLALCRVSQDPGHTTGECIAPVCTAGTFSCHGPQLMRCAAGSDRWEPVALCATPEVCQNTVATDPAPVRCVASACQPDEYACEGSVLKHCNPERLGWETRECGNPANCSAAKGACTPCTPGETECNHGELRTCTAAGDWETLVTCAAPALCDVTAPGGCKPAECSARGETRCVGEAPLTELQECGADLSWRFVAACVSPSLCLADERRCIAPGCRPGETRCVGDALQTCAADLSGFVTTRVCPAGTCDSEAGTCSTTCTAGSYRCNDVHLEQCVDGRFQHLSRCASRELCDANPASPTCREPVCGGYLGERLCRNSDLYSCAGRSDWGSEDFCASQALCDAGTPLAEQPIPGETIGFGPGSCVQCIPGAKTCSGNELRRCQSDGQGSQKIADCPRGCASDPPGPRCNP